MLWVAVLLIGFVVGIPSAQGAKISEAVVRIRVANGPERSYGSGGYIGAGLVLTCAHIFTDGPERHGDVFFWDGSRYSFRVQQLDARWDQAVLLLNPIPVNRPALVVARANPRVGEKIWAYGYGKGRTVQVTTGTVRQYTSYVIGQPSDWVVIEGRVDQGSSGGPLINSRGEIIGPLWGTRPATTGWETVGILTGRTRRFLLPWNAKLQGVGIRNGLYPKGSRIQPGGT